MIYLTLDQQQSLFHSEIISIKEILIGIQIRLNCFLLLLINSGLENLRQFSSCIYIQGGLEQLRQMSMDLVDIVHGHCQGRVVQGGSMDNSKS